jgi:hypothetical protein
VKPQPSSFIFFSLYIRKKSELWLCIERIPRQAICILSESENMANLDAEDEQYFQEVEEVKKWWSDSRWRYTRRPFTAEQIVAKRGTLKIQYPSNEQSKKLWGIVEGRFKVWNRPNP